MSSNNIDNNVEFNIKSDNQDNHVPEYTDEYDDADMVNLYDIWLEQHEEDYLYYEDYESYDE